MNWALLQNSLLVSGGATLLAVSFGFVAGLLLVALAPAWRNRLLGLAVIAMVLPPFLVANCWLHFLGLTGVWRSWLPLNIYSLGGAVWILALLTWPISVFACLGAWRRLEAAQLESDPALRGGALIRWLLWPMARVSLGQAAVLTFVLALNNFAVPAILQVKVFPAEIWVKFSANFNSAEALLVSWPLLAAPLLLLVLLRGTEIRWPHESGTVAPTAIRSQLGKGWFWMSGSLTVAILFFSIVLPLVQILAVERTWTELPGVLRTAPGVIGNSVIFAAGTATLCIVIPLIAWLVRSSSPTNGLLSPALSSKGGEGEVPAGVAGAPGARTRFRLPVTSVLAWSLWVPLLLPGVFLGIALICVFNRPVLEGVYHTAGIVLLAWTIRYLALGWNGVGLAFAAIERDLVDAARIDGASRWALLWKVQWPQIAPRACAAWYLTYLLCLWDVETIILIYPPGGETLALRIFNLLHYGHNAQVNALCLLLLTAAVAPLALWSAGHRLTGLANGQ